MTTPYIGGLFKVTRIGEALLPETVRQPHESVSYWERHVETQDWFDPNKEHLIVLTLNTRYAVTGFSLIGIGSLNEGIAHPREIFRPVLVAGAYALILMHNHPSGNPEPSEADHRLTRRIHEGAALLNLTLLDHVIVPTGPVAHTQPLFSFKEAGVI